MSPSGEEPELVNARLGPDDHAPLDDAVDILSQVSLQSLTVNPDVIGPFGAALLTWKVDGPRGFGIELNRRRVARRGERVVQPLSSTTYTVVALARGARRLLGSVTLNVDLSRCDTFELAFDVKELLEGALASTVESGDIYLRQRPIVTFTPSRISFRLKLGKRVDKISDPTIRIEGSFGLSVQDGEIVAVGEAVDADVSVPKYVWLLPGAMVWLPIMLSNGKHDAMAGGRRAIAGLVDLLAFSWTPADGVRRHSLRIVAEDDFGGLEVTECPSTELRELVVLAAERDAAGKKLE